MTYDELIKEADFLDAGIKGFLGTIKDQVDFKNKPFETLFGVLGTAVAWRVGWIFGSFITIAELFGYGPGEIGKLIDQYFFSQGASSVSNMNLSKSNIEAAAKSVISTIGDKIPSSWDEVKNKIKNKLTRAFVSNLQELKEIKGSITNNDKKAVVYTTLYSTGFTKTAKFDSVKRFFYFLKKSKKNKIYFFGEILMKLIWAFAKGLTALGIAGGVASMMGIQPGKSKEKSKEIKTGPRLKHYSNVNKDVKRTLLTFLNASIANFSRGFIEAQKRNNSIPIPVENAPGWRKVMEIIEEYNWAPISMVDDFSAFVGPKIDEVARILLKSVNISGVKVEKLEPKTKPIQNILKDEDKLEQLLQRE